MATNIGTGPQDIPLNQFLGEMAFIDKPSLPPMFWAFGASGTTKTNLGKFTDAFVNTTLNNGGCYNTSTGVFTAPVDGVYEFHLQILARQMGSDGSLEIGFRVNGAVIGGGLSRGQAYTKVMGTNDHDNLHGMVYINLSTGDTVYGHLQAIASGTDAYLGDGLAYFSGKLVG